MPTHSPLQCARESSFSARMSGFVCVFVCWLGLDARKAGGGRAWGVWGVGGWVLPPPKLVLILRISCTKDRTADTPEEKPPVNAAGSCRSERPPR